MPHPSSDESKQPNVNVDSKSPPSIYRLIAKWAIICGLVGLAIGSLTGFIVGMKIDPRDNTTQLEWALNRGLLLGLVGLVVGGLSGALEWWIQAKKKPKS